MTEVFADRFCGNCRALIVLGHAGYAEKNDIVCAAVSSLFYALLGTVERDKKTKELCSNAESGKAFILFRGGSVSRGAFEMAINGFNQLAETYPRNVKVYVTGKEKKHE